MPDERKLTQGTPGWFHMIGETLVDAATNANLPDDMNLSFVERYSDGEEIGDGLVQGIRLDIRGGKPSYRIGAGRDERGDLNVLVTAKAARMLNSVPSGDPRYGELQDRYQASGEWHADGDLSGLGDWLEATHDPIVARTK